jgi:hypothetical protein
MSVDLLAVVDEPGSAGDGQVEQVRGVVALGGEVAGVRRRQVHAGAQLLGDGDAEQVELQRLDLDGTRRIGAGTATPD